MLAAVSQAKISRRQKGLERVHYPDSGQPQVGQHHTGQTTIDRQTHSNTMGNLDNYP